MSTNYDKVRDFNISFEVPVFEEAQQNIFDDDPKLTKLRLKLIEEEIKELIEAVKTNDFVEVIDALCDILYVVYGAGCSFGVNLDSNFKNNFMNEVLSEFNDISIYKKLYNFLEFSKSIGVQRKLPYVQVLKKMQII